MEAVQKLVGELGRCIAKKMFKHITKIEELNLRALAELSAKHRTFLTVYFNGRKEWEDHKNNIKK